MNIEIINLVRQEGSMSSFGYEVFVPAVFGLGNASGPQEDGEGTGKAPAKQYGKKKKQPKPTQTTQKPN